MDNDAVPARPEGSRLSYVPAIDGLRAVAVALVLAFHGGWSWFRGGYVGVSLFFTLSGYLITALLLAEHGATGTVSLRNFYLRRVRRLMPASVLCLAAVVALAAGGVFRRVEGLAGDVVASALQVANWRELAGGQSYAQAIGAASPSPLEHFWSLAVEEQFYWVWPVCVLALLRLVRSHRSRVMAFALLTSIFMVVPVGVRSVWGADAVYWSTPARLGEVLVGAALAVVASRRPWPRRIGLLGWLGLAAVIAAAMSWPSGSGPAYSGWLPVLAIASAAAVAGVSAPGGLARVLAVRPLVWLGRVSYGVYLYHWPVFVLVDRTRLDVPPAALFALRILITLVVAGVSYHVVEAPLRRGGWSAGLVVPAAAFAVAAVAVTALVLIPPTDPGYARAVDPGAVALPPATSTSSTDVGTTEGTESVPAALSRPLRIVVLGDSTAVALSAGVVAWAEADLSRARVAIGAHEGCGLTRTESPWSDAALNAECAELMDTGLDGALVGAPEVAVVMIGLADTHALVWDRSEGRIEPSDPRFRARLTTDYDDLLQRLLRAGVRRVEWVLAPPPADWWLGWCCGPRNDEVRQFNEFVVQFAARYPEVMSVHHLDDWLLEREAGGDREWRPDGLHLGERAAARVLDEYLGPALLALR